MFKKSQKTNHSLYIAITSLLAGLLIFGAAFTGMRRHSGIYNLNTAILDLMINIRTPLLTIVAKAVTYLAEPDVLIIIISSIIISWIIIKKELWRPVLLGVAMVATSALSSVMKLKTMNLRPPKLDMVPPFELSYSFPSGHTIATAVLLLVVGYLIYSRRPLKKVAYQWLGIAVFGILAVGLSRLYLGYHWLTDVTASVGLGLIILSLVILIDRIYIRLKSFF